MNYATADLHGYPLEAFLDLLHRAGFCNGDTLYVLGDVIDRNGDGGVSTLLWMLDQPNVQLILGNHEDMLLSCASLFKAYRLPARKEMTPARRALLQEWMAHGGRPTLKSLFALRRESPERLNALLSALMDLPLYETASAGGRDFVLVHSGLGNFRPRKPLSVYTSDELLIHRPSRKERYFDDMLTVFGHTPTTKLHGTSGRMLCMPTWIDIDTGAGKGGAPMLFRLEDLEPFYAK